MTRTPPALAALDAHGKVCPRCLEAARAGRPAPGRPVRPWYGMRAPSVVPFEMPGLIEGIVRSQVAGDLQLAMRELRGGRSRTDFYAGLRMLVAHVLLRLGYHPKTIGMALNRDRSTIIQQQEVFTKRLAANRLLAARVERVLAATGKVSA